LYNKLANLYRKINQFNNLREEFIDEILKKNLPESVFQMSLFPKRTGSYILGKKAERKKDY